MQVIRVFPTKTRATPNDKNTRFEEPGLFDFADEIHISVLFTWDIKKVEFLFNQWSNIAPVKIGGPGIGQKGNEFIPGMYIKKGYVITSRGCPNKCWFCDVWKRDGSIRELEIKDGWNVLDDNLLSCSTQHIKDVFRMLRKQKHPIEFTGGFEAKRFKDWHVDLLLSINLGQLFFAYDNLDDYQPLYYVSNKLKQAGIIKPTSHKARCYVLIGYPEDTIPDAHERLIDVMKLGFMPMAMLYRNHDGNFNTRWKQFQREWANPIILGIKLKKAGIKIYEPN